MALLLSAFDSRTSGLHLGCGYNIKTQAKGKLKYQIKRLENQKSDTTKDRRRISSRREARVFFSISPEVAIRICFGLGKVNANADLYKDFVSSSSQSYSYFAARHVAYEEYVELGEEIAKVKDDSTHYVSSIKYGFEILAAEKRGTTHCDLSEGTSYRVVGKVGKSQIQGLVEAKARVNPEEQITASQKEEKLELKQASILPKGHSLPTKENKLEDFCKKLEKESANIKWLPIEYTLDKIPGHKNDHTDEPDLERRLEEIEDLMRTLEEIEQIIQNKDTIQKEKEEMKKLKLEINRILELYRKDAKKCVFEASTVAFEEFLHDCPDKQFSSYLDQQRSRKAESFTECKLKYMREDEFDERGHKEEGTELYKLWKIDEEIGEGCTRLVKNYAFNEAAGFGNGDIIKVKVFGDLPGYDTNAFFNFSLDDCDQVQLAKEHEMNGIGIEVITKKDMQKNMGSHGENVRVVIIRTTKEDNFDEKPLRQMKVSGDLKKMKDRMMAVPPNCPKYEAEVEILQKQLLCLLKRGPPTARVKASGRCTLI